MTDTNVGGDVFFVLLGAILVFAMHGGFAFLEVGTVRQKNQVNALVKILVDFAISTIAYFLVGFAVAYGTGFFVNAATLSGGGEGFELQGLTLVKFFFLTTFAAAIPAIISGGIAERMKFLPQCLATAALVGIAYPLFEGVVWNGNFGVHPVSAPRSMISPAPSSCMPSADGSRSPPSCSSVPAGDGMTAVAGPSGFRRHRFPGLRWARGCCASAGSAST